MNNLPNIPLKIIGTITFFTSILISFSFRSLQRHVQYEKQSSTQDSITIYLFYKVEPKGPFYIYQKQNIIFKSRVGAEEYAYDSLKIAKNSFSAQDFYLSLEFVGRNGKKATSINCKIQNLAEYNYILLAQNNETKKGFSFAVTYYNHPVGKPRVID